MGASRRRVRSGRSRDGPAPTSCVQAQCFDLLLRHCVSCKLLRTLEPGPASPPSDPRPSRPPSRSPAPAASNQALGSPQQPQESVGAGLEAVLPLPELLVGAPVLLGLVLALAMVAFVSWKWRQQSKTPSPETPDGGRDEPLDNVFIPLENLHASAPVCSAPKEESDSTPPGHSIPVPATELGSTELVTTKTAGPEQQQQEPLGPL